MRVRASGPALGVAAGAFAVICCAALPAIGAPIGAPIASLVGGAGGVLALAAPGSGAIVLVRARRRRRRRSCRPSARGSIQ
jgi:hypothetical protein